MPKLQIHREGFFALFIAAMLYTFPSFAGPLEDAQAETERAVSRTESGEPLCIPHIRGSADVHVLFNIKGGEVVDPSLTEHPSRYLDVRVEITEHPVFLVLSADESVVWRIDAAQNARIAGVYLTGYYEPMITGLPEGVPLGRAGFRVHGRKKSTTCDLPAEMFDASQISTDASKRRMQEMQISIDQLETSQLHIRNLNEEIGDLENFRAALANQPDAGPARGAVDRKIIKARKTVAFMTMLTDRQRERVEQEAIAWKRHLRRMKLSGSNGYRFDQGTGLRSLAEKKELVSALAEKGSFKLAAFQAKFSTKHFTVSDGMAEAFKKRKSEGKAGLAALEMPTFDLLDADLPRMAAPEEMTGKDGVAYLAENGYLERGGMAELYYCEKLHLTKLAQGVPSTAECKPPHRSKSYTILGPITLPSRLCGGDEVRFFLPPGVAEPEGRSCTSQVINLEDDVCIDDFKKCLMAKIRH